MPAPSPRSVLVLPFVIASLLGGCPGESQRPDRPANGLDGGLTFVDSLVPVDQLSPPDQLIPDGGCEVSSAVTCYTGPSGTLNVGACKGGERRCQSGAWSGCIGQVVPGTEVCDGQDNDCDGSTDEEFWAAVRYPPFATLASIHPDCTPSGPSCGACMSASSNFCKAQAPGGFVGGFGVQDLGPTAGTALVTCMADASYRQLPIGSLTGHHESCTMSTAFSAPCFAAIHRHCTSLGFVSGVGPVEINGIVNVLDFICTKHAQILAVPWQALSSSPGCGPTTSVSAACAAAVNHHCVNQGFATGFGPVEIDSSTALITCLRKS